MASLRKYGAALEEYDPSKEWFAFDLDGTAAEYSGWKGAEHIGEPIPKMIELIKSHLEQGHTCKWFTARVGEENEADNEKARDLIDAWSAKHLGTVLEITNKKDKYMVYCYDDRSKQVVPNTGIVV